MRSFGHRLKMADTTETEMDNWNEARHTGIARAMRLGMSGLMIVASGVLFILIDPSLRSSIWVVLLILALIATGIYDILSVLKSRIYWNDTGIRRKGLLREGRLHLWKDLTYIEKSMNSRATVLTFKGVWKIKIFWAYRAHRELAALAKQKLKENKAARGWRKSRSKPAKSDDLSVKTAASAPEAEGLQDSEEKSAEAAPAPETPPNTRIEPTLSQPRKQDA